MSMSCIVLCEVMKVFLVKGLIELWQKIGIWVCEMIYWNQFDVDVLVWCCELMFIEDFVEKLVEMCEIIELVVVVVVVCCCMVE